MAPKKRCRKGRSTPDSGADTPVHEMYTRSKRRRTGPKSEQVSEEFEDELIRELQGLRQKELETPLDPWASPPEPNEENNQRGRPTPFEEFRPPTLISGNPQQVQQMTQRTARDFTQVENPTRDERLDWYVDAALREIQVALRLAGEGRLRQADLWDLLAFGQHMYAGMKEQHGIDLNSALVDREGGSIGGGQQGATPAVGSGGVFLSSTASETLLSLFEGRGGGR